MRTRTCALALVGAALAPPAADAAPREDPTPTRSSLRWGDFDRDGLTDALVLQPDGRVNLMRNSGAGTFEDVTARVGLGGLAGVHLAEWGDADGDGRLDLLLAVRGEARFLHQAEDGTLVDATEAWGLPLHVRPLEATWRDVDGDGLLDLHLVTAVDDLLYRSQARGRFEKLDLGLAPRVPGADAAGTEEGQVGAPIGVGGTTGSVAAPGVEPVCALGVVDQANPADCLPASSYPALGHLYPLSNDLYVDGSGYVGLGTTAPTERLHVGGKARATQFVATGAGAPIATGSNALNVNLNADLLDGLNSSAFSQLGQSIEGSEISDGTVQGIDIMNLTLMDADVNPGAGIAGTKISPNFGSQTVATAGTGSFGSLQVGSNGLVTNLNADLLDGLHASAFSTFGSLVDTGEIADLAVTTPKLGNGAVTSSKLGSYLSLSGDLTADAGTLFVDASANRVGVGITNPVTTLHVNGTGEFESSLKVFDKTTIGNTVLNVGAETLRSTNGNTNVLLTHLKDWGHHGYISVHDEPGDFIAGMYVATNGNGIVYGDVKNFVADNPADPETKIWYACVEGPEAAAYVRGTASLVGGRAVVQLPDHFRAVATAQDMTVLLTPRSAGSRGLAVVARSLESFEVRELFAGTGDYEFDWEVKTVRKGFEDYEVIRPISSYAPQMLPAQVEER